jgi:16S rRNA (guanine966-N2)-methyltransferase
MTRIIGGSVGGRRLATPKGQATRPTSDRVREALFSAIEAWCGSLDGLRFLDLYAGSGAVGLEARSRGAGVVTLVEHDKRTAALISQNARTLGLDRVEVHGASVSATLARHPVAPYDVVFADPPYPLPNADVEANLADLVANGWLSPDALVIVERAARGPHPVWPDGIEASRDRRYGETLLRYGHAESTQASVQSDPTVLDREE